MAAVTTKKPGGDVAVQLTFPAVFAEVYADSGEAKRFAPTFPLAAPPMREAVDLQGAYHAQKRQDAHRMVMAAVAATKEADRKMLASHANYYGMPKPVLSQRRFANPSLGNLSGAIDSARRTMPGSTAPFRCMSVEDATGAGNGCGSCYETQIRGGVLFTKTGQQWAAKKLQERVKQLDTIDAEALTPDALESGVGVEYKTPGDLQEMSLKSQLDMSALFGDLLNSLMAGNTRAIAQYALADLAKLTRLVARWSVTATDDEFREALENIDAIYEAVLAQAAVEQDVVVEGAEADDLDIPMWDLRRVMELVAPRVAALREYIQEMYDVRSLTPRDRKAASKTFLKSTGLTKLAVQPLGGSLRTLLGEVIMGRNRRAEAPEEVRDELAEMADDRARNIERRREGAAAVDPPRFRGRRDDDDSDDDDQFDAPARPAAPLRAPGGGAPRFAVDNRQRMGARHGAFVGEALPDIEVIEMGVRNPARQMAPAGLLPQVEAADPVFADMAAVPAGAAAAAAPRRAPRARARAPVVAPGADLRRWFGPAAAGPQGRGRGRGGMKRGAVDPKLAALTARRRAAALAAIDFAKPKPKPKAKAKAKAAAPAAAAPAVMASATAAAPRRTAEHEAADDWWRKAEKGHYDEEVGKMKAVTQKGKETLYAEKLATTKYPSKGSGHGLTRATLPKDREGYVALASKLRGMGHNIRVNSGSQLKSIRANFIKKLGL
jgi:hypothetical protein